MAGRGLILPHMHVKAFLSLSFSESSLTRFLYRSTSNIKR